MRAEDHKVSNGEEEEMKCPHCEKRIEPRPRPFKEVLPKYERHLEEGRECSMFGYKLEDLEKEDVIAICHWLTENHLPDMISFAKKKPRRSVLTSRRNNPLERRKK